MAVLKNIKLKKRKWEALILRLLVRILIGEGDGTFGEEKLRIKNMGMGKNIKFCYRTLHTPVFCHKPYTLIDIHFGQA